MLALVVVLEWNSTAGFSTCSAQNHLAQLVRPPRTWAQPAARFTRWPSSCRRARCPGRRSDRFGGGHPPAGERPFVVSGKGAKATVTAGKVTLATAERVRMLSGEEKWKKYFQLRKIKNHFLFTIESTGILPPHVLLKEALAILRRKCDTAAESLDNAVDMET